MKNKKAIRSSLFIAVALMFMGLLFAEPEAYFTKRNVQVQGWLFGDAASATWSQERFWTTSGTSVDTLAIAGLDTTCIAVLTAKTTKDQALKYDFESDTLFVTSDSTETTGKYSVLIIQNGYGATD